MDRRVIEVPIIKYVAIGHKYRITNSWGYAGILEGVVEVVDICTPLEDADVSISADTFIEAELGASIEDYRSGNIYDLDLSEESIALLREWDTGLWVRCEYPTKPEEGIVDFPINLFVERVVSL